MDHLVAATVAEKRLDFTAFVADDRPRIGGGIGDQPGADAPPLAVPDNHRVAALEGALDPDHAGRQQTLAGGQGLRRTVVDGDLAAHRHGARDPALARGARLRAGQEPGAARALVDGGEPVFRLAVGDHHAAARGHGDLGRHQLGHHAARGVAGLRGAGHGLDLGRDLTHLGHQGGTRIAARVGGIQPVDVGQQHQRIGADHLRHPGGEPVVVAEADFIGRHGVVLVDHRHRLELQQGLDGVARIQMAPALLGVAGGEQDLGDGGAVARHGLLIGVREADLTRRRGGLLLLELEPVAVEPEFGAPDRDGAGGHQHHLDPRFPEPGDIGAKRGEPRRAQTAGGLVHQQDRADLDDQPPRPVQPPGRRVVRFGLAHGA